MIYPQEIQADLARQQRVKTLAAQIQARDDEERACQIAAVQSTSSIPPPEDAHLAASLPPGSTLHELREEALRRMKPQETGIPFRSDDGPQVWSPKSVRGRSGGT